MVDHERAQVFLSDELAARHVPHVDRIESVHTGLLEGAHGRLHEQVPQARAPQLTEAGHPRAYDRNLAHLLPPLTVVALAQSLTMIFSRNFAYSP
jgi:hypothetical protein